MIYQVTVDRIEVRKHTFFVSAESEEEASDKALHMSRDHNFLSNTVCDAWEEVNEITKVQFAKSGINL